VTPRILLVEDNPSDEKLTLLAFRSCTVPHELVILRDGQQALEHLAGVSLTDPRPALILLDLKLPRVDGFEVLRRIRADAQLSALPVVVLSASAEQEDIERVYLLGANAYVRKPVDFADFKSAVQTLGEFWLRWNERAFGRVES
jgi:two-component system, response regulator